MEILNQHRSDKHTHLYLIGRDDIAEYAVKVTDRWSVILGKHVTETVAYSAEGVNRPGFGSAQRTFHKACLTQPVLVLREASIEKAMEALA